MSRGTDSPRSQGRRTGLARAAGVIAASAAAAFLVVAGWTSWAAAPPPGRLQQKPDPIAALKAAFARPRFVPFPADNPPSPAKIALGKRLFEDKELSSTGTVACASCHDPKLSFTDGEVRGKGVTGRRLERHTPTLWNIAFSPLLFWDGRAANLEEQVRFPVEHRDEMGGSLANAVDRLSRHESYVRAFAEAFPDDPHISARNIGRAVGAYERTLVSPPTRFDQWVAGDASALSPEEMNGLKIFTGKGGCIACHSGFSFTDHNFYDIGLPDADLGRGKEIGLPAANHAFKTPTLRELAWTAPYMHDGSLATLEDVVRHYEKGGAQRATRSKDLPKGLKLTEQERSDLVAFLQSLSSDSPPQPSTEPWVGAGTPAPPERPADRTIVSQANKTFAPASVRLNAGQTLTVLNDDTRTHNVRIFSPSMDYNSGAQEPHQSITIPFPVAGTFEAFCGIHPSMRLHVEVK